MRVAEPGDVVVLDDLGSTPDYCDDADVGRDDCATPSLCEQDGVLCIDEYLSTVQDTMQGMGLTIKVVSPSGYAFWPETLKTTRRVTVRNRDKQSGASLK
jgi:hypothetical protein